MRGNCGKDGDKKQGRCPDEEEEEEEEEDDNSHHLS